MRSAVLYSKRDNQAEDPENLMEVKGDREQKLDKLLEEANIVEDDRFLINTPSITSNLRSLKRNFCHVKDTEMWSIQKSIRGSIYLMYRLLVQQNIEPGSKIAVSI